MYAVCNKFSCMIRFCHVPDWRMKRNASRPIPFLHFFLQTANLNHQTDPITLKLLNLFEQFSSIGHSNMGFMLSSHWPTYDIWHDFLTVSGPTSHLQLSMARSKSSSSMLSLRERERGLISRDSSSKDSSNGEDDFVVGDASDITNARRVTFRADHRLDSARATFNFPLRKCQSVSFQHSSIEKRLRMMSNEH